MNQVVIGDTSNNNENTLLSSDDPPHEGEDFVEGKNTLGEDETDNTSNTGVFTNKFQSRREVTKGLYDVALLMANVSQLKSVLDSDDSTYYMALVCLLSLSIALHLASAILLYILLIIEKNAKNKQQHDAVKINSKEGYQTKQSSLKQTPANESEKTAVCTNCFAVTPYCRCWKIYKIDIIATFCVFGVTVLNIFITAFGSSIKS
ncbi:ninjurin-1-like isoform X2 [Mytilus californianus]|uniref:ninjurin-1-like isoform X2 n=1 Tax=Mytilus californianus TaxID=6549 RepID=UPI0022456DAF|nr:ninjurin-1-like isoform X2 [Mytilus californianus]